MKKHLALIAVSFAVVMMASTAIAQDTTAAATPATATAKASKKKSSGGGAAANKAATELASLTETLKLTDDQQAKIKPILADETAKIHATKGKKSDAASTASADDAKAKTKAIREDSNKQIRALLTPDQQKIFDGSKKEGGKKSAPTAAPAA
jgi:Spy/CpxP family protein refolding chaperone